MKLTKYRHSCVRLDDGDRALVLDPGVFSELDVALVGADAVLITHEHADHVNVDKVNQAAAGNSQLKIWAPISLQQAFLALGDRFVPTGAGERFTAAGFEIETFGGQHAVIHPSIRVVDNIGYLINDTLYHPGDSFSVPTKPVETLLVPVHAPWSKISEVLDFVVSVRAAQAFPIHEGLLNSNGLGLVESHLSTIGGRYGTTYTHLESAATATI